LGNSNKGESLNKGGNMITRENFKDVVLNINEKDKTRIINSNKEYIVIELHCFNVGIRVDIRLTNDYNRYKNVSYNGNCILPLGEVIKMLKVKS